MDISWNKSLGIYLWTLMLHWQQRKEDYGRCVFLKDMGNTIDPRVNIEETS